MVHLGGLVLLMVAVWARVAVGQECSLYDNNVAGVNLFNYPSFDASTPLIKTWTNVVGNALRLTIDEPNGGTTGYAWHNQRERVADGFVSTFKFKVGPKSNPGDGFTYFIQNFRTFDLNGGSGDKLGSFGIPKSIAVKIDLCTTRPNPCTQMRVGLQITNGTFFNFPVPAAVNVGNLADGTEWTVTVVYQGRLFGASSKLRVNLTPSTGPTQQLFDVAVGNLETTVFNDRFAYFGFTASTSWTNTANIDITSWRTDLMPSDSYVRDLDPNAPFRVEFGTVASFKVARRTSCKQDLGQNDGANVSSTLIQQPLPGQDPLDAFKFIGNVTNNLDGTYTITYNMPPQVQAVWDLDIVANGVRAEGMPYSGGVVSFKPSPGSGGLPIWALILLLLLILLIILVLSYVVYRLYRYRKKLQQNAEFIEAGRKQAELDRLEDGVSYSANKMVGTIDDLKSQLTKNEEELERLRKRGALGEDQNFTIEQLQKQRDALLEEMNRLKREEQEEELKRTKATETFGSGGRAKKEFGREQI